MSPTVIGLAGTGVLVIMLFLGVPIGPAMAVVGFAGFAYMNGFKGALGVLSAAPFSTFSSYALSVIPLFVIMGIFAFKAGISRDLYVAAYKWLARLPGGLAVATIGGCAGFSAVCGSSVATSATLTVVALPEMKKFKYDSSLATGSLAAGGTLGILIPPSICFVVYGVIAEVSIGRLFVAGILPGILETLVYMATIYILCRNNPLLGPPGPGTSWKDKFSSLPGILPALLLFVLVIGGIYGGIFTPNEAAGVGAFGALLLVVIKRKFTLGNLTESLLSAGQTTAMLMFIVLGGMIFGYFLTVTRIPQEVAAWAGGLPANRYIILSVILLLFLFLGCIMDNLTMIILVIPVIFPVITTLGFDGVWFGVVMVIMSEMGLITPPVGLNVFVLSGMASDVPMFTVFKGIMPFLIADFVLVVILVAFPEISLLLPNLMKG